MSESFAALFEESLQRTEMRPGEVITAEVVRIEHNFVVVNAGLKSESYVPLEEFKNDQGEVEVQVGDFVSVAIGSIENGGGAVPGARLDRCAAHVTPRDMSEDCTALRADFNAQMLICLDAPPQTSLSHSANAPAGASHRSRARYQICAAQVDRHFRLSAP